MFFNDKDSLSECKEKSLYSINLGQITKKLNGCGCDIQAFDTIDSTNTYLKEQAILGAPEKTIVIANEQTSGRGRRGKSFFSPSGSGLYLSILLKPQMEISDSIKITTCAAVSVCEVLESYGLNPQIKWVNDIYIDGKKVCGILTEAGLTAGKNRIDFAVLGIGINLFIPKEDFPQEITQIAGAAFQNKNQIDKNEFIAEILNCFFKNYALLNSYKLYKDYADRMFLIGSTVIVKSEKEFAARVTGVNRDFSLKVELENSETININSGEVSIIFK